MTTLTTAPDAELVATPGELEVITYIQAENEKVRAWMNEVPGRWGTTMCSDLPLIREYGYTSVEVYIRKNKEAELWDGYKSVHGIKPRWMNIPNMSDVELDKQLDQLQKDLQFENELEEVRQNQEKAKIAELCERFLVDEATLTRWGVIRPN